MLGPLAARAFSAAGLLLCSPLAASGNAAGQQRQPPARFFLLPIEVDFDYGASSGSAVISRLLPIVSVPLGEKWRLQNLTLAVVAHAPGGVPGRPGNPEPVPGGDVFGLGDLTSAVFFVPPTASREQVWGFGPALSLPIATDARLGSGKWTAGPAFRFALRHGAWNLGALVTDLGSYAGDADRGEVHQLLIRALVRRELGGGWYFTYSPVITANWNASSGKRWLVPLGGGIGRTFDFASQSVAVSFHAYWNVVKPDGAPGGLFRIDFVLPIPMHLGR